MWKNSFRLFLIVCLSGGALVANAQPSNNRSISVTLPILGLVTDSSNGLRPLVGVPGSASIGRALELGFNVTQAAIPPGNDYVLAMTPDRGWPLLLHIRGNVITVQALEAPAVSGRRQNGCDEPLDLPRNQRRRNPECAEVASTAVDASNIDRIALSPTGSSAALFSEKQARIYLYTNLSQSPRLVGTVETGALGPVSAFGISDDGKTAAVGVSDGQSGALFVVSAGQLPRMVASLRHPSAIAFLRGSDGAIVADDLENTIYRLANDQILTIATAADGIAGPIAIAVSKNNQRIFIANSSSSSVTTIGPVATIAETRSCDCAVTGLHATNADSVFRLTDFSGGPVLLFDATGSAPRMVFAPLSGPQF